MTKPKRKMKNQRATWQVRTRSEQPFIMEDQQQFTAPYGMAPEEGLPIVMREARIMIGRASYMVNGPNREVMWSVERWDTNIYDWVTVVQGRSKVKSGAMPL